MSRLILSSLPNIVVVGIAIFVSTFTLWIIDAWVKYPLFVLEIIAIITIYSVSINSNLRISSLGALTRLSSEEKYHGLILDIFLIGSSIGLMVLNGFLPTIGGVWHLILAFGCVSFLSGYAILTILKLTKYFSKLEILLLSYLMSFIFSGFISILTLPVNENIRTIILPVFYLALGIVSIIKRRTLRNQDQNYTEILVRPHSFSRNIDILAILVSVVFYFMFFTFIYPNATSLPGTDISRHYGAAIILSRSPELYTFSGFSYVLFHAFEGALLVLSGLHQTVSYLLTTMVTLNIFLPLSIYVFAKKYLSDIDKRIPPISVIFYSIFSNFSFIYYTQLKILGTQSSEIQFLVADRSYNGIINFLQPFSFFVPLSISTVLFISVFFLLKVVNIPKGKFVPLFSILIFSMYLTHVPEAVIFAIFLAVYSFASRTKTLRLDDALLSSLIGFIMAGVFFIFTSLAWISDLRSANINFIAVMSFLLPILLLGGTLLWRKKLSSYLRLLSPRKIKFATGPKFYHIVCLSLIVVYLFGFLTWFFIEDFKTSTLIGLGTVPWFIYPLLLGIVGLLAILSIIFLSNYSLTSSVAILLTASGFMFLFGRVLSFISLNYIIADYWEKRFVLLIFIFVCLLAPIPLIALIDRINNIPKVKKRFPWSNHVPGITLIGIIVFSGFSSMALQTEYWLTTSNRSNLSEKEFEAVTFLKDTFQHDSRAYVITPSALSRNALVFAAPPYQFSRPEILVSSQYPDIPLLTLKAHNLSHAYLYMHDRDFTILNKVPTSWIRQHLIPMLPVVFSNSEVKIYNATSVSYPVPNSNTALIIPSDPQEDSWLYAYDVLSQSDGNWTALYNTDQNYLKNKIVVLSYDPKNNTDFYEIFSSGLSHKWNVIKGNWNFSTAGLHVIENSDAIHNVVLSPLKLANVNSNITTSFRIFKVDPAAAGYISIVYSWLDPKNFEYAGITIRSNEIYLSFGKVKNGILSFDPSWPGIKTNLQWKPGERINMTLSTDDKSEHIYLNGIEIVNRVYENRPNGYVGLGYGRAREVIFDNFRVQMNEGPSFSSADYIRYVQGGGHLVVLNTNGYGSIEKSFFNMSASSSVGDNIIVNSNKSQANKVPNTNPSENLTLQRDTNNLEQAIANRSKSSFSSKEIKIGEGKITYINIYPILSSFFENNSLGVKTYEQLGKISKMLDLSPVGSAVNFKDISAMFRNFTGKAKLIEVNTSAVIFPRNELIESMTITAGHRNVVVKNVDEFTVNDSHLNSVSLHSNDSTILIGDGTGIYTRLVFSNDNIKDKNKSLSNLLHLYLVNNANVKVSQNEKVSYFANVSDIQVNTNKPVDLLARQPKITVNEGNMTFEELYSPQQLYGKTGVSGQDLKVSGNLSLSVFMNDVYTLVNYISLSGSAERVPPLSQYNDLAGLPSLISFSKVYSLPLIVRIMSLIPFLVAGIFIAYAPRNRPHTT